MDSKEGSDFWVVRDVGCISLWYGDMPAWDIKLSQWSGTKSGSIRSEMLALTILTRHERMCGWMNAGQSLADGECIEFNVCVPRSSDHEEPRLNFTRHEDCDKTWV